MKPRLRSRTYDVQNDRALGMVVMCNDRAVAAFRRVAEGGGNIARYTETSGAKSCGV